MGRYRHRALGAALTVASLLVGGAPARAGEAHYLLMFGAQRVPNNPNYAHSFAVFVRASWAGDGPCAGPCLLEARTISWLPANLEIRTGALLPEPGHNFELHETIRFVLGSDMRLSLWGPYPTDAQLYEQARARADQLEGGAVRYKANDSRYLTSDRVTNCIHALSSITAGLRLRVASPAWGEPASYAILQRFRRHILDETPDYRVSTALGLDAYPIIYRERIAPPRSAAVLGPVFRLLGRERGLTATYGPPGAGAVTAPIPTAPADGSSHTPPR